MKKVSVSLMKKVSVPWWMKKICAPALLVLLAVSAAGVSAQTTRLPFVEDDYNKALAEASRRRLPVFVDVWAPW
jgi:P pilus assembly chaperone PapD